MPKRTKRSLGIQKPAAYDPSATIAALEMIGIGKPTFMGVSPLGDGGPMCATFSLFGEPEPKRAKVEEAPQKQEQRPPYESEEDREQARRVKLWKAREIRHGRIYCKESDTMTLKCTTRHCKVKKVLENIAVDKFGDMDMNWVREQGMRRCTHCDTTCCTDCIRTVDGVRNTESLEQYVAAPSTTSLCPDCYSNTYDDSDSDCESDCSDSGSGTADDPILIE